MKQLNLFTGLGTAVREVKKDDRYRNTMQFSNIQNARDESDRATWEAILCNMSSGNCILPTKGISTAEGISPSVIGFLT